MTAPRLNRSIPFVLLLTAALLPGCQNAPIAGARASAAAREETAAARAQIAQIPPPSKSRYMTIRSFDRWENPSITVQPDMLTLHVMTADVNPSSFGAGGMLRPAGARRQEVNISPGKLAEAMTAIPQTSWPYGRVVAVEEAHGTPARQEPTIRRNLETTVGTLNDLGLAAYDLREGNLR